MASWALLAPLCFYLICFFSFCDSQLPMTLRLLPNTNQSGAVCLDGSPGGYYYSYGSGDSANKWMIFFEGGGWCYSVSGCYARALTSLGSSKTWTPTVTDVDNMNGFITDDCTVNPLFCNYSKVIIKYCDGTSYTSNNVTPTIYNDSQGVSHTIYFRGRVILSNILDDLIANAKNFSNANTVLLSGCSAGGLAVYHAADFVRARLPNSVKKYAVLPISGYFLPADNTAGDFVYPSEMYNVYEMGNCSYGVIPACWSDQAPKISYRCLFATFALPYVESPIFISNSMFDSWQLACILTSDFDSNPLGDGNCSALAGWASCFENRSKCTPEQWAAINAYAADFVTTLKSTSDIFLAAGNGGFIDSCIWHCEAVTLSYVNLKINGVSIEQAVTTWWNSLGEENNIKLSEAEFETEKKDRILRNAKFAPQKAAVESNWYWDCTEWSSIPPYKCNPLCG